MPVFFAKSERPNIDFCGQIGHYWGNAVPVGNLHIGYIKNKCGRWSGRTPRLTAVFKVSSGKLCNQRVGGSNPSAGTIRLRLRYGAIDQKFGNRSLGRTTISYFLS